MKQIIRLQPNRYIHLDTYVNEDAVEHSRLENFFIFSFITILAAVITAAMLGCDFTTLFGNGSTRGVPVPHSTQVEAKR